MLIFAFAQTRTYGVGRSYMKKACCIQGMACRSSKHQGSDLNEEADFSSLSRLQRPASRSQRPCISSATIVTQPVASSVQSAHLRLEFWIRARARKASHFRGTPGVDQVYVSCAHRAWCWILATPPCSPKMGASPAHSLHRGTSCGSCPRPMLGSHGKRMMYFIFPSDPPVVRLCCWMSYREAIIPGCRRRDAKHDSHTDHMTSGHDHHHCVSRVAKDGETL